MMHRLRFRVHQLVVRECLVEVPLFVCLCAVRRDSPVQ